MLGSGIAAAAWPSNIARLLAAPGSNGTGTIADVEHIVFLMQENRSFDHYFGTMRGVRGFADPRAVRLPSGAPVWQQPTDAGYLLPYRVNNLATRFLPDPPHGWNDTHAAWNAGRHDQWVPNKGETSMTYYVRTDLPYYFALADAFTICDDYHCSVMGPTDPNRYHMWTGWVGNDGAGGGPVITNAELGYDWSTYPERLERGGISWKVYQDAGVGLDGPGFWGWTSDPYIGNYGDNSLLYFHSYQNAATGSPLYQGARTGTEVNKSGGFFDILAADVRANRLPSVSWVVAPEAYTEHPAWPAGYGAWYTAGVLNALTSNPDVWSKTALIITFDENDGFFDHVPGPYPNVGDLPGGSTVPTDNEFFAGVPGNPKGSGGVPGPYGLGIRVPLLVISPWSTGGYVCSEIFDHSSLVRLLEARFGVREPNITPWRRAICGDLTSAFDFESSSARVPRLPSVAGYKPNEDTTPPTYHPQPPAVGKVPKQEPGVRPSRRLGYRVDVGFEAELH